MKNHLLTLSLIASSGLMAQTDGQAHQQTYVQNNACCDPCCNNPRPCVDGECYTPAFNNLECDCGFFFDIEFLYWYAMENNIPYAAKLVTQTSGGSVGGVHSTPTSLLNLDAKWDPGVRVGIGWNRDCDGWDTFLSWTYYKNTSKQSASAPEFSGVAPTQVGDQSLLGNFTSFYAKEDFSYGKIDSKWVNRFNQIDLTLGRKYWLSRCFVMHPFGGIRGAWTKTDFSIDATDGPKGVTDRLETSSIKYKDRHWGVGILFGLESTYYFTNCFALYLDVGASLVWGELKEKRSESVLLVNSFDTSLSNPLIDVYSSRMKIKNRACQKLSDLSK